MSFFGFSSKKEVEERERLAREVEKKESASRSANRSEKSGKR